MPIDAATEDFFRLRLDHMIDLRHALAVLSSRMPWQQIEASVAHLFSGKVRAGKKLSGIDLFGEQIQMAAVKSNAGRPRVPLRTMIALLYLKHAFNESDEGVVQRWSETPVWQFFGGRANFEQALPCDATTLVKFSALLGEDGVEELLSQTITAAVRMKLISPKELATVVVDSTVQPKAIAHPTDSKLLETARQKLVVAAKDAGIDLKQTFAKERRLLRFKAGRYAHAKQFKRMGRAIKRQRTIVARIARQMERGASALTQAVRDALQGSLAKARQIVAQAASRKNTGSTPKLYAWHAPEVECIAKGKSKTPYEFGVKVGIAATLKQNLIVGARSFAGKPNDGHTPQRATGAGQHPDAGDRTRAADSLCGPGLLRCGRRQLKNCHQAPGQVQNADRPGAQIAQAAPGHRAHHRAFESRPPDGSLLSQGRTGRPAQRSVVRCGLQHQVVAAHDRQEGSDLLARPLFAPVRGSWHAAELGTGIAPTYANNFIDARQPTGHQLKTNK